MAVSVLLKIKFGYTQIGVPKISIPMSKTACINTCKIYCCQKKRKEGKGSCFMLDICSILTLVQYRYNTLLMALNVVFN